MSFRFVRSPDAPKMVRMQGSGVRRSCRPSSSGFSCVVATSALVRVFAGFRLLERTYGVTAELLAERGCDLRREIDLVAGRKAGKQRGGDHRYGNVLLDRLEDRPAPLARVLDVGSDVVELRPMLLERGMQQLEQPGPDDRAVPPDAGDLVQVEVVLGVVHDLEPFRVRLHQAVL